MSDLLNKIGDAPLVQKDSQSAELVSEQVPFGLKDVKPQDILPPTESAGTPPPTQPTPAPSTGPDLQALASSLEELKAQIAKRDNELNDLRNENAYYRTLDRQQGIPPIQPFQQPNVTAPPQYGQPVVTPPLPADVPVAFDYGNPEQSIAKIVQATYQRQEQERIARENTERQRQAQEAQQRYISTAYNKFQQGKSEALSKNPEFFKGIERELEEGITQAFFKGDLSDDDLRRYETWEKGAKILFAVKGQFDRLVPNTPVPPKPVQGEIPSQRGQATGYTGDFQVDDKTREIMKAFHLTETQAREIVENERKNPIVDRGSREF